VRRTGEVKIGGGMAFISMALDGELVGLEEILHGIWRVLPPERALLPRPAVGGSARDGGAGGRGTTRGSGGMTAGKQP
jgi:hypothetical protein